MTTQAIAPGVHWDLSDFYSSIDDPKIRADLEKGKSLASQFENKYKPLFEQIDSKKPAFPLSELLTDYKEIIVLLIKPSVYSQLSFSTATNSQETAAFMQKVQDEVTQIQSHLLFFEVQWNSLPPSLVDNLLNNPELKNYEHYLRNLRVYSPHTLTEGEEKIMSLKSNTSSSAFSRLFDEVINNIEFYWDENGTKQKKNESEILSFLHSSDRNTRKQASNCLADGLDRNTHILTYIYNMILADHRNSLQIRNYKHPMDPRNLANETDLKNIQSLIQSVKKAYPLAQRYYKLKSKLLGLEKLYDYDRYAPLKSSEDTKINYEECKQIVLEGYNAFSPEVGAKVEQFFTKNWIDAEVRDGKRGGGFCCSSTPDLHPYILVNYTGSMRDVMTVAHECGHGLHGILAAEKVGLLEMHAPLTLAETASVFGEMLIFEKILEKETDPQKQLSLICGKIDDNFATVFRQIVMTDFELQAHEAGLKDGELSSDKLSDFWIQANAELYGDSIELTESYRQGWKYIPHFVHTPFYCYAYSFAQLFVLTLYQKYKEEKDTFIPKYIEMLSLGGSKKPEEIALIAGLDLKDPHFWDLGVQLLEDLVTKAENLAKEVN